MALFGGNDIIDDITTSLTVVYFPKKSLLLEIIIILQYL